jgi:hypothetical protein
MNPPKLMIGMWDSPAGPQVAIGIAHSEHTTAHLGIIEPDGSGFMAFEVLGELISGTANHYNYLETTRKKRFTTHADAAAQISEWARDHHEQTKAGRRKQNAKPKPAPRAPANANEVSANDTTQARRALKQAMCRKFPNSMAAMLRGETSQEKIIAAYGLDVAELTGDGNQYAAPRDALLKALRRHRRSPRKRLDFEIEIAVALNWTASGWCFKSGAEIAAAISKLSNGKVSIAAARKRVERMGLTTLKPRGPAPNS